MLRIRTINLVLFMHAQTQFIFYARTKYKGLILCVLCMYKLLRFSCMHKLQRINPVCFMHAQTRSFLMHAENTKNQSCVFHACTNTTYKGLILHFSCMHKIWRINPMCFMHAQTPSFFMHAQNRRINPVFYAYTKFEF